MTKTSVSFVVLCFFFIGIERAFLKHFVVSMFEKGCTNVASESTIIHFNTHIATHRRTRQPYSDVCAPLPCVAL